MDPNIRCFTLLILIALFAPCLCLNRRRCMDMETQGYTFPERDIFIEYGKPLDINCTLYSSDVYNSSSLTFFALGAEVDKQYLTVINSTTLRYYREKPSPHEGIYTCKLRTDESNYLGVCLNMVFVGFKPLPVDDFKCVSHNWNNLDCEWVPPHNYPRTNYSLSIRDLHKHEYACPVKFSNARNKCFINATTEPVYRQTFKFYKLILVGSNALGTNRWVYNISHYSIVIPDKPRNLTEVAKSVDSISLLWYIPFGLEHFPPGVIHNVSYKTVYDNDWQTVDTSSLCVKARDRFCSQAFNLNITDLKYPNTVYNISVRSRSGKDDAHPYRWSEPAYITVQTSPTLPLSPPHTVIGSFEIVSTNIQGLRNVNLYWKEIPPQEKNGDGFEYKIISVEENGFTKNIIPSEISKYSANFQNLTNNSYKFKIISHNIVGPSKNYSQIIIPSKEDMPVPPEQVTQIPYSNGIYEISWERSYYHSAIDNYTVFWFNSKLESLTNNKSWFNQRGDLNWIVVNSEINAVNITSMPDGQVYHGVAVNRGGLSSGIVWASCTILPGRGGAEMKPPDIDHRGPNFLYLSWKLECSNRFGVVSGFLIEYCLTENCSENITCASSPQEIHLKAGAKRSYNLTDLKPYSTYAIFISVISKSKPNLKSRARCAITSEGVPDRIQSVDITEITNSSVSVRWTSPRELNGKLVRYLVQCGDKIMNVTDNSATVENLESFRVYNVTVSACTYIGCGVPSAVTRISTLLGRPGVPTNAGVKFENSSLAKLYWTIPKTTAGNLTFYTVEFEVHSVMKKVSKFRTEFNVSSVGAELPWEHCEINADSRYKVRVRAANLFEDSKDALLGDWSEPAEGPCSILNVPTHLTVIIPLVGVLFSLVLCIFCGVFSQHLWVKFNQMRDIGVKLPARLGKRQEDKVDNHVWNNHISRENDTGICRPSPDEQSLLKVKEEIELMPEETPNDRNSFGGIVIQNSGVYGTPDSPTVEADAPITPPSPGYIRVAQPSGYVTIPPLVRGYIMATVPPSPNVVSPPLPQCSIESLKPNNFNSTGPKPCSSFPEPNNLYGDMISPLNSN